MAPEEERRLRGTSDSETDAEGSTKRRSIRSRPGAKVPKGYETTDSILLTEPRIEAIRRELRALLEVVELESDGKPVAVDGFRLRDISRWADYPASLSSVFWHLSSVCNFRCEFCYEKGNPADFPIRSTARMASPAEIQTRLRHYDPIRKTGIFAVRTAINEPFANRNAIRYLRMMREKCPEELISFVTNGAYLDEPTVAALAELRPLFFNLSIYSTDPAIRREVIRDRRGDKVLRAVELLRQYRLPYMANLVMWPSIPLADMERTIAAMAESRATVLRVCLSAYSRYLEGDFERFHLDAYWPEVVDRVERIRDRYPIAILIEPNSYVRRDPEAYLDAVVADSPAARAGLGRGDLILAVNGRRIGSRMQLLSELRRSSREGERARPTAEQIELAVERRGERFTVVLDRHDPACMASYPYGQIARFNDFMYGLVITDTLSYSSLKAARELMARHGARRVLLLTSPLIEPILAHMLSKTGAFQGYDVAIRRARNHYFGGTINLGDLLVVTDFVEAVRGFLEEEGRPDLVLIPASPFASSPWGRDLTGRPWTDVERLTGIAVDLIPCANITC